MEEIWNFHIRPESAGGRGWIAIAYQALISEAGVIYEGRPHWAVGSHCPGWNSRSVGLCLLGDLRNEWPPEVQMKAAMRWIADTYSLYGELRILGHGEAYYEAGYKDPRECPGVPWPDLLRRRVNPYDGPA